MGNPPYVIDCDRDAVVILMILATAFYGTMFAGVFSNHVDVASNYAGVLMGMSNMSATIPGFAMPALVGAITHGDVRAKEEYMRSNEIETS